MRLGKLTKFTKPVVSSPLERLLPTVRRLISVAAYELGRELQGYRFWWPVTHTGEGSLMLLSVTTHPFFWKELQWIHWLPKLDLGGVRPLVHYWCIVCGEQMCIITTLVFS